MGRTVGMAEFKAKCVAILHDVQATGDTVTVTSRGKPIAVVQPTMTEDKGKVPSAIGFLKNDGYRFDADPSEPAGDPDGWAALR